MDLFNQNNYPKNIITKDGIVNYYGYIFYKQQADSYYDYLLNNINWKNDEAFLFGKKIVTKRKVAWYAEKPFEYKYSNITKIATPFTPKLIDIKTKIETITEESYNSCLLNLYHNGSEGMAWHSDGEKDLKKDGAIASVTFGAERKFAFKHKTTKETVSLILPHGSLLVMKDKTQTHWLHRLPPTKKVVSPRINLTFRTITS